jgi:WD repeat-containing protein 48
VTKTPLETLFSHHLTPPSSSEVPSIRLPEGIAVQIAEETSAGWKTIYRGSITGTHEDWRELEQAMPMWLLEYLLMNRITVPPVVKIGFLLLPWRETGGRAKDQLPELLNA